MSLIFILNIENEPPNVNNKPRYQFHLTLYFDPESGYPMDDPRILSSGYIFVSADDAPLTTVSHQLIQIQLNYKFGHTNLGIGGRSRPRLPNQFEFSCIYHSEFESRMNDRRGEIGSSLDIECFGLIVCISFKLNGTAR
ncbi:unnamed protein product [Rhizophagus irregularis]|nr:unnamed protein product [Rhizophagus irregularis]